MNSSPSPLPDVSADLARLDEISSELETVELALGRLDEATYGTCELCGAQITTDRLVADPLGTRCSAHFG